MLYNIYYILLLILSRCNFGSPMLYIDEHEMETYRLSD